MTERAPGPPSAWWFPATYVVHATEEYCCGDTFPVWISRLAGVDFTATAFLWLNGIALAAMVAAAAWLAGAHEPRRWLVVTLATIVVINGLAHAVASVVTRTYSPGVVSGTIVWLPLGAVTLRRGARELPRRAIAGGIALGVLAHAVVSGIVIAS